MTRVFMARMASARLLVVLAALLLLAVVALRTLRACGWRAGRRL